MAETPFSPDPGAPEGGQPPEGGNQGSPAAASAPVTTPGSVATPAEPATATPPPADVPAPEVSPVTATVLPVAIPASTPVITQPPAPSSPVPTATAAEETSAAGTAAEPPGVAATIAVPPLEEEEASGEGGEWEMLVNRFNTWWESGEVGRQWQRIRGPLKGVAIVVAVLLALRVYATVVSTIDAIPLVSGLLELTGLIAVLHFSVTRLLRTSDRREVLSQWQRRWLDFRGRE